MTDEMLELRLREWYRADTAPADAPVDLRASVLAIPEAVVRPAAFRASRFILLAAATLLAIAVVGGALVVGSALFRLNRQGPVPTPSSLLSPPPSSAPTATPTEGPTDQPTQSPAFEPTPQGVGSPLIVAYHSVGNAAEIVTINPSNLDQNIIGSVPVDSVQLRSGVFGDIQWSSDHRLVSVSRVTDGVQIQAVLDPSALTTRLISVPTESYISPAEDRLAAVDGTDVIVMDLDGNVLQRMPLPPGGTYFTSLTWAPDGSAVLVGGMLDGPAPTPGHAGVGGAGAIPTGPTWLFVVPADGSAISQFSGSSDFGLTPGGYSPDMTTIVAMKRCVSGRTCTEGIVAIDVASGAITQLTTDADLDPVWSADGSRIAFERSAGSGRGVWVMNPDGSGLTRLTAPPRPAVDHSIVWSPDGSTLLFSRGDTSTTGLGDLYELPLTGGEPQLLLNDAVGDW